MSRFFGLLPGQHHCVCLRSQRKILGVKHDTLIKFGAVSREIALEMARGARKALAGSFPLENLIGISVTGIAGPGGGMPKQTRWFVYIGMSAQGGDWVWKFLWKGNRLENKVSSTDAALTLLLYYWKDTFHLKLPDFESDIS